MLEAALQVTYHAYDVSRICYYGFSNAYSAVVSQREAYTDPKNLMSNIIMHFGAIWDSVRDTIEWIINGSQGEEGAGYRAAYGLGNAIYIAILKDSV